MWENWSKTFEADYTLAKNGIVKLKTAFKNTERERGERERRERREREERERIQKEEQTNI